MISRRGFFGVIAAAVVAPSLPKPTPAAPSTLAFHKDAFALTMQPHEIQTVPLRDPDGTVRYVRLWPAAPGIKKAFYALK